LKTLEEPPEHVVFVLATTDPQKVSETIRSRVQHLQFHLLPMEELSEYVHWVAKDAGLDVDETSLERVLQQGGGSARDTLSALELVASGGGDLDAPASVDELIEALINHDQGRALAAVAFAVQQGRDPRTFTEDIIRALRDAFLSLMAPELVQLPDQRADVVANQARSLGAASVVRAMETLGSALIDMRHAPDPRLLLEVSVVKMASPETDTGIDGLMARIAHLEETMKRLQTRSSEPALPPAPVDPTTGRAAAGSATGSIARPQAAPAAAPNAPTSSVSNVASEVSAPAPASAPHQQDPAAAWPQIVNSLQKLAKAIFASGSVQSVADGVVTIELANKATADNASKYVSAVEAAVTSVCGSGYSVKVVAATPAPSAESAPKSKKKSIVEDVKNDPTAPVDPNDILEIAPDNDPTVERLRNAFPGAQIVSDKK
jgi:DNA polymerase-3 subunit gamma/tau